MKRLFVLIVLSMLVLGCVSNPSVFYNRGVDAFNNQNYDSNTGVPGTFALPFVG
jgi:hypothetical protein